MSGWRILQALFARELRLVLRGGVHDAYELGHRVGVLW